MTADQLKDRINGLFRACDGPATSYFECGGLRFEYTTFHACMVGEADKVGSILCEWAYATIRSMLTDEQIEDAGLVLFWRRHPMLEEFTDPVGKSCTALRFRVAIPDLKLIAKGFLKQGDPAFWL